MELCLLVLPLHRTVDCNAQRCVHETLNKEHQLAGQDTRKFPSAPNGQSGPVLVSFPTLAVLEVL